MRLAFLAVVVLAAGASGRALHAQSLAFKPNTAQYVTVDGRIDGALVPGGTATLTVEVTPKPGMRIYAAGAKDFQPVALVMTPHAAIIAGKAVYPASELDAGSGLPVPVPVYRRTFHIAQPIVVKRSARVGQTLTLAAAVNYQACDDRLCYPSTSIPVVWTATVR